MPRTTSLADEPRARRRVLLATWSVPVLILAQFALLAAVPVALVLAAVRRPDLRVLRPWAAGLGIAYAVPVAVWALDPDRAGSLSKEMSPALSAIVVLAAGALLVRLHIAEGPEPGTRPA